MIVTVDKEVEGLDRQIGRHPPFRDAAQRMDHIARIAALAALFLGVSLAPDSTKAQARFSPIAPETFWLKTSLIPCAWSAVKTNNTYLRAPFYRIRPRRGPKKATILRSAASILTFKL